MASNPCDRQFCLARPRCQVQDQPTPPPQSESQGTQQVLNIGICLMLFPPTIWGIFGTATTATHLQQRKSKNVDPCIAPPRTSSGHRVEFCATLLRCKSNPNSDAIPMQPSTCAGLQTYPAIAQLVEHLTVECCSYQMVPGSIPGGRTFATFHLQFECVLRYANLRIY